MTSTWAGKKKSNGTYRACLNLRGSLQVEGEHYDAHSISSPVVMIITIHIMLTMLTVIVDWYAVLVDVRGAFLLGDWESDQQIYMEVPKGWTHHYPVGTVLCLLKTAYGAKQSAKRYWILWLTVMDEMGFTRSQADPCLYYKWHPEHGLLLMMSFIDDVCIAGTRVGVELVMAELFVKPYRASHSVHASRPHKPACQPTQILISPYWRFGRTPAEPHIGHTRSQSPGN
jgi:Reverse transcriptase (RNA-dependent DNA polymerase)